MVEQYLAVRVVDDALLHDGRRDDVVHLLRHHNRLAEVFSDRLVHIAQVISHVRRRKGLPSLLHDKLFSDAFQPPHLVDKCFHDDNRNHWKKLGIILHRINFEDHEPLVQQVDVLRGVEQEVVPSALVILPERGQEVVDVEVRLRHLDVAFLHLLAVHVPHVLVERVERRHDALVLLDFQDVGVHRAAQLRRLRFRGGFVLAFPQGEQQSLDAVLLLHVEHPVVRVERVERDGLFLRVGEVDAVPALRLAVYHLAQPLVRVARIDQHHVGSLFVILPDKVVHEE